MGTTLVTAWFVESRVWVGNVGDSRAYLARVGSFTQQTVDHSEAEKAVRAGELSREDAAQSPLRHILTRAIGTQESVEADISSPISLG